MSHHRPPTPPYGHVVKLHHGYEMHYLEEGKGAPVVWVHGSGPGVNAYSNFAPNYKVIAAAGFRSVMPDMIGFGWSSKPTGIDYTLELFVQSLREFLDQLEIRRCILIGNSLGGAISMKFAIDHPERVEKLVVMGPGGIESRETYFKMPGIQKMVSQFTGAGFDKQGLKGLLELSVSHDSEVRDRRTGRRTLQRAADAAQGRAGAHDDSGSVAGAVEDPLPGAGFLGRGGSVLSLERLREDPARRGRQPLHHVLGAWVELGDDRARRGLQPLCPRIPPRLTAKARATRCPQSSPPSLYQALLQRRTCSSRWRTRYLAIHDR